MEAALVTGDGKDSNVFEVSGRLTQADFSLANGHMINMDETLKNWLFETSDVAAGTMVNFSTNTTHGNGIWDSSKNIQLP